MKVLFTFSVVESGTVYKPVDYRAVQAKNGGFRMEKKGIAAKKFKAIMWCGSLESLVNHYEAVQHWYGKRNVTAISPVAS